MKFLKKGKNKTKNFWVEEYTEKDKRFLESLGFVEDKREFNGQIIMRSMYFRGSGLFGWWSNEEADKIYGAIQNYLGVNKIKIRVLTLAELI